MDDIRANEYTGPTSNAGDRRGTKGVPATGLREAINAARGRLSELKNVELVGIPGAHQISSGWCIRLEVSERQIHPGRMNTRGIYEVEVEDGGLIRYERRVV